MTTITPLDPDITPDPAAVAVLWAAYCTATGLPPGTPHGAFAFGSGAAMADELLVPVLSGAKRATAGVLVEYEAEGQPWDRTGFHEVVVDGRGQPACILRYTACEVRPFDQVDEDFARAEGEGDLSLAWWRDAHFRYYDPFLRARFGRPLAPDEPMVLERFTIVWPPALADR